ncbi:MAG: hypothetical protein HQ556_15515 [Candidatus Marinimicrobia bacterium]|nr:hypothetical protein [Candidatus Neomarinimicrobiota bacterium]
MEVSQKTLKWLKPLMHLYVASLLSLVTAIVSFRSAELDQKTLITFMAYYFILGAMTFMFRLRVKLINPKTKQLLQFSFFLLGFVLMLTGVLGMLSGNFNMVIVFLLVLFSPGLAILRAGLHFNKTGD